MKILDKQEGLRRVFSRTRALSDTIRTRVADIIADIRERGDEALFEYTKKLDGREIDASCIEVGKDEIDAAYKAVPEKLLSALRAAKSNIEKYHKKQMLPGDLPESAKGGKTGYVIRPVSVAGVGEIVMCTPGTSPLTLVAAAECGVSRIFRIGGAQAIAAMAYGTESVPRADVVCGPGNMYVTEAKKQVYGACGIDMIAGPSEILVIADGSARPDFLAADLLSQAEHDEMAMSILVTPDRALAEKVSAEVSRQSALLPKRAIAEKSIDDYGTIIIADDLTDCVRVANEIAPEHLELCVEDPHGLLPLIRNAGAVFMGHWSPEPLGDYYAGTNHVLPNGGTARFFSALGVSNFVKRISLIEYGKDALCDAADDIVALAEAEGLEAHARSLKIRFKEKFQ